MKQLIMLTVLAIAFASCEKKEGIKKSCPIVAADGLPKVVSSAFQAKYPTASVQKWFNKDNKGYCALVTINGIKKLIQFDNGGNFIKEETDIQQQGEHQDNEDDNECECDTEG